RLQLRACVLLHPPLLHRQPRASPKQPPRIAAPGHIAGAEPARVIQLVRALPIPLSERLHAPDQPLTVVPPQCSSHAFASPYSCFLRSRKAAKRGDETAGF